MRDYWTWEIDLRREKLKLKTFCDSSINPCHKAIREVASRRRGDKFYLDGNKIIRHRIDVVGTYKVTSVRSKP